MPNKSMKPSAAARPKALTREEREQAVLRQFMQKRESLAGAVLVGIAQNPSFDDATPESWVNWAVEAADALLKKLYTPSGQGAENEK